MGARDLYVGELDTVRALDPKAPRSKGSPTPPADVQSHLNLAVFLVFCHSFLMLPFFDHVGLVTPTEYRSRPAVSSTRVAILSKQEPKKDQARSLTTGSGMLEHARGACPDRH
ncbi:hypothetical protein PtA15_7A516 [Puccinia triticina]|uniref:Uncharacterized protein n=1 Tax=Puccinia triticina TaxID=208348 RepID=A0ABY7CVP8_9BASI|nr:uncharacterized protein PtA15_7A516 [Puccinia triticina]WAQ86787.1 hypothetical protein PtA15_7A516 [Puccinia triticina]